MPVRDGIRYRLIISASLTRRKIYNLFSEQGGKAEAELGIMACFIEIVQ